MNFFLTARKSIKTYHYPLALVSLILVLVMTGCDDFENEPLKGGSKQTSQSTPSIRPALIAPARTPLDGDVKITMNVTEIPDRSVRIHGTTVKGGPRTTNKAKVALFPGRAHNTQPRRICTAETSPGSTNEASRRETYHWPATSEGRRPRTHLAFLF